MNRNPTFLRLIRVCCVLACGELSAQEPRPEHPCSASDAAAFFQVRNLRYATERFAGLPRTVDDGPPIRIVAPPGQVEVYAALSFDRSGNGAQGWSLSIDVRGATLLDATVDGTMAAEVTDDPPGIRHGGFENVVFFTNDYPPVFLQGVTSGVVLSFTESVMLEPVGTSTVLRLTLDGAHGDSVDLLFMEDLLRPENDGGGGSAPWNNTLATIDGQAVKLCPLSARLDFDGEATARFQRCDANDDGSFDLSDGIWILKDVFADGVTECPAAADCNGDRRKNLTDAVYAFQYLFRGGRTPPPPFPGCGTASSDLGCPPLSTRCP